MDKPAVVESASVSLTVRLIMQGKVRQKLIIFIFRNIFLIPMEFSKVAGVCCLFKKASPPVAPNAKQHEFCRGATF